MEKAYNRFRSIVNEIDDLLSKKVTQSSPEFSAWNTKVERFLSRKFGPQSYELEQYRGICFTLGIYSWDTPEHYFVEACAAGLKEAKAVFKTYLEEMEEDIESQNHVIKTRGNISTVYDKVFVVHGHNGEIKEAVARLVEKQGIQAIILHEQANQGATIIEKFERNSDVGCAVCLFTADDLGRAKTAPEEKKRARQNVVFEAGYFIGKLGRNRVVLIADRGVEIPSDLQGVVYTETTNWQYNVLKELKAIGYNIDYNKLD